MRIPAIAAALGALVVSGCASQQSIFRQYSVLDDDAKTVLIDAKQRAILAQKWDPETEDVKSIVCAEPSPDVASALGGSFAAGGGAKGVSADVAAAYAESVAKIAKRNATVSLLRDAYYRHCEMYMNGAMDDETYRYAITDLNDVALTLLAIEQVTSPNAGDAPIVIQSPGTEAKITLAVAPDKPPAAPATPPAATPPATNDKPASSGTPAAADGGTTDKTTSTAEAKTTAGQVTLNYTAAQPVGHEVAKEVKGMLELILNKRSDKECTRYLMSLSVARAKSVATYNAALAKNEGAPQPVDLDDGVHLLAARYCVAVLDPEKRKAFENTAQTIK